MTKLHGLVAATHTPFREDGELNLSVVELQAAHLHGDGVRAVFVGGSTGESHSLTLGERLALSERWASVAKNSDLKVIAHVGSNCLADARTLAEQAQKLKVWAISAISPSYFLPPTLDVLIDCCQSIASAAPELPFYFYDIPSMTGVRFSMPDYLERAADRIPTLAGIKFSNPDLMDYQRCLHTQSGRFDMPWGTDEYYLSALAVGGVGGVGSSYNFAAPIHHRLIAAFEKGDLATAQAEQFRSVRIIQLLGEFGYMAAAKAVMEMRGVPVGAPRLPHASIGRDRKTELQERLQRLGFFDWVK